MLQHQQQHPMSKHRFGVRNCCWHVQTTFWRYFGCCSTVRWSVTTENTPFKHIVNNWIRQHSFSSISSIGLFVNSTGTASQQTHSAVWRASSSIVAVVTTVCDWLDESHTHNRACECLRFILDGKRFGVGRASQPLCERAKKKKRTNRQHTISKPKRHTPYTLQPSTHSTHSTANGILFWYIIYPVFRIAHQFNERFRLNVMCGALNQWELRCTCSNEDVESLRAVRKIWTNIFIGDLLLKNSKFDFVAFSKKTITFLFLSFRNQFGRHILCVE